MLAKVRNAASTKDFRPIACLRILYKVYAHLLLGRMEEALEQAQPEEQCGFRGGRRLEEHVLTANIFVDEIFAAVVPAWLVSLDLSKAFDRVHWEPLFQALLQQGVPRHLVWSLQKL
jgi:hypothetical protein